MNKLDLLIVNKLKPKLEEKAKELEKRLRELKIVEELESVRITQLTFDILRGPFYTIEIKYTDKIEDYYVDLITEFYIVSEFIYDFSSIVDEDREWDSGYDFISEEKINQRTNEIEDMILPIIKEVFNVQWVDFIIKEESE
jgi:hypothetical protein